MEAYEVFNAEKKNLEETCEADHEIELQCDDA